ncbi:MAG TPA: metal ABC transporter ATP-binding protein [Anaerolineales bacterium]|nr:metal ABC transporter ATP-binding protein [Anaerolineales bacterium]
MEKPNRHPGYLVHRFSAHEKEKPALKISGLSYRYNSHNALDKLNFEVNLGERLAVVGPNGAGKSTLFKVVAGVIKPSQGTVSIYGHEPSGHICIAYVPQRSQVDWNFPVNVSDVVMMGRVSKMGPFRWPTRQDWKIVHQALDDVGMLAMAGNGINELSGGQQQRVFIARALAQEAELILMDEPFTGLDQTTQDDLFQILDALRQRNVTVMVALHDLKMAAERFDRVLLLNRKLVGLGSAAEVLSPERLQEAYGGHLRLVPTSEGVLVLEDTCCDEGEHLHV